MVDYFFFDARVSTAAFDLLDAEVRRRDQQREGEQVRIDRRLKAIEDELDQVMERSAEKGTRSPNSTPH
jgi:hypothetical protein